MSFAPRWSSRSNAANTSAAAGQRTGALLQKQGQRKRTMRDFPPLAALAISLIFLGLLLVWAQDLGMWQCDWCIRRLK